MHQWKIITSQDLVLASAQEKEVGMAIDMELARRSAIFLGNGVRTLGLPARTFPDLHSCTVELNDRERSPSAIGRWESP